MQIDGRLTSKGIGLIACFTALYSYLCFVPAFPIVGLSSKAITLAAITAPIIGIILGPYLGTLCTALGGLIGFFSGSFSPPSFVSGIVAAAFAGLLHTGREKICILIYLSLLTLFGFYPSVGPIWLHPPLIWFQIIIFLVLISPLQSVFSQNMQKVNSNSRFFSAFFATSLSSTLAGQIAGSFVFEFISWPILVTDLNALRFTWQLVTWIYPLERVIIALGATFIGVFLYRTLPHTNLGPLPDRFNHRKHVEG